MKKTFTLALMAFACAIANVVLADSSQRMDYDTLEILAESQKAYEENGADEAIKVLTKFQNSDRGKAITPHDLAHVMYRRAQFAIEQKDLPHAIDLLKSTLEVQGDLEYLDKDQIRYQLAQVYFGLEIWDEGLAALDDLEGRLLENWKIYFLKAQAYRKLGDEESARQEYLTASSIIVSQKEVMPPRLKQFGVHLLLEEGEEDVEDPM